MALVLMVVWAVTVTVLLATLAFATQPGEGPLPLPDEPGDQAVRFAGMCDLWTRRPEPCVRRRKPPNAPAAAHSRPPAPTGRPPT